MQRCNGATAQRRNGATAQRRNGAIGRQFFCHKPASCRRCLIFRNGCRDFPSTARNSFPSAGNFKTPAVLLAAPARNLNATAGFFRMAAAFLNAFARSLNGLARNFPPLPGICNLLPPSHLRIVSAKERTEHKQLRPFSLCSLRSFAASFPFSNYKLKIKCSVEIISLTPRFNAVNHERAQEKPFKRFFSLRTPCAPG